MGLCAIQPGERVAFVAGEVNFQLARLRESRFLIGFHGCAAEGDYAIIRGVDGAVSDVR